MFDWLRKKITRHEVTVVAKREGFKFRRGMWVVVNGKVGIYTKNDGPTRGEVHFVNDEGTTTFVGIFAHVEIRQARISEVPECRRDGLERFDYQE